MLGGISLDSSLVVSGCIRRQVRTSSGRPTERATALDMLVRGILLARATIIQLASIEGFVSDAMRPGDNVKIGELTY